MGNLNKVFLMGNLTRDPELRYTPKGTAVASFGIAINSTWRTPEGEQKEETCFVDANIFGKRAEVVNKYFSKGKPIFIEGRLQFRQWETKDGQKRNNLSVVIEDFQFIGARESGVRSQESGLKTQDSKPPTQESSPEDVENDVSNDEIPF